MQLDFVTYRGIERPVYGMATWAGDTYLIVVDDDGTLTHAPIESCRPDPLALAERGVLFYAHRLPDDPDAEIDPPVYRVMAVLPGDDDAQFVVHREDWDLVAPFETVPAAEFVPCGMCCPAECTRDAQFRVQMAVHREQERIAARKR